MKNSETQRKLLSAIISPSEALSELLIDEKGDFNHQRLPNMAKLSTKGSNSKSYKVISQVKKEPSINTERGNTCMKCGSPF